MIGSCDVCGEYCADIDIDMASRHLDAAEAYPHCRDNGHEGPWHEPDGSPCSTCETCGGPGISWGDLDHERDCPICAWGHRAGRERLLALAGVHGGRRSRAPRRPILPAPTGSIREDLLAYAASCRGYVRSTDPADRARVEAAFATYAGAHRLPLRWVDSPVDVAKALQAAIASTRPTAESSREETLAERPGWALRMPEDRWTTMTRTWATAVLRSTDRISTSITDHLATAKTTSSVMPLLASAVATHVWDDEGYREGDIEHLLIDAGQFDGATWELAAAQALGRRVRGERRAYLELLATLAASCGPIVVLKDEIVVSDRPLLLGVDAEGRLHADAGPAIAYRDGLEAFAWHGVAVPEDIARDPASLTLKRIDATVNVETRRVMIERFGFDRLTREGGAQLVHEDSTGRLWRRPMNRGGQRGAAFEPMQIVEVLNSTPEPDGSRRTYFLRVPPQTQTAHEAVAWTFGLKRGQYRPAVES